MSSKDRTTTPDTPECWHWAITLQQIEQIRRDDRKTIDKVYFDNLPKFRRIVNRLCRNCYKMDFVEDVLLQIYIDLQYYDYTNCLTFYRCILQTFKTTTFKKIYTISFEYSIGDGLTLADVLSTKDNYEFEFDEENRKVVEIVAAQTQLTNLQKDILIAYAFDCVAFRGLYDKAYKQVFAV
ncbi:unknown [Corallococcus sp. CAG:1435]|nr:unknown [Corallococcus sp. CAG:1435]